MRRPLYEQNKIKHSLLQFVEYILALPRQQLAKKADGMATVMADGNGNCDGRR